MVRSITFHIISASHPISRSWGGRTDVGVTAEEGRRGAHCGRQKIKNGEECMNGDRQQSTRYGLGTGDGSHC